MPHGGIRVWCKHLAEGVVIKLGKLSVSHAPRQITRGMVSRSAYFGTLSGVQAKEIKKKVTDRVKTHNCLLLTLVK